MSTMLWDMDQITKRITTAIDHLPFSSKYIDVFRNLIEAEKAIQRATIELRVAERKEKIK